MTVTKKVKQEGDVEYYELDTTQKGEQVYASNDLKLASTDAEADAQQQAIADERAPVEPGVRAKKTFLKERNK